MHRISRRFTIKLLLSIFILGLVWRSVDAAIFWATIRSIDVVLLMISVLMFYPNQLLAAYRWHFLLKKLGQNLPFWFVLRYSVLGQVSALVLPGQISGDIVRTVAIATGQSRRAVFIISVVIDKAILMTALAAFAFFGTVSSQHLSQLAGVQLIAISLLIISLTTVLLLCWWRSPRISYMLDFCQQMLPPFVQTRIQSMSVAPDLKVPRLSITTVSVLLLFGFAVQLINTVGSFVLALSMHIVINPIEWGAINAIVAVVQVLPFSIGGLGIREGAFASLLSLYAVPAAQATAFSLTSFVCVVLLIVLCWSIMEAIYETHFKDCQAPR